VVHLSDSNQNTAKSESMMTVGTWKQISINQRQLLMLTVTIWMSMKHTYRTQLRFYNMYTWYEIDFVVPCLCQNGPQQIHISCIYINIKYSKLVPTFVHYPQVEQMILRHGITQF